jgi:hypothetical protein
MSLLRKNIALFLILVLSVYIVPKEFVHSLYQHEDTTDYVPVSSDTKAPFTIDNRHVHCDLLNFETDVFHAAETHAIELPQPVLFNFLSLPPLDGENNVTSFISLRGPPRC